MNLAVVMDSRFFRTPVGYFSPSNTRGAYWRECARYWDRVFLFVRCWGEEVQVVPEEELVNHPSIEVIALPPYEGVAGFLRARKRILSIFAEQTHKIDIVNARGPGQLSDLAIAYFGPRRPTIATIIGDPEGVWRTERSIYRSFPLLWPFRRQVAACMRYRYRRQMRHVDGIVGVASYLARKYQYYSAQPIAQIADTKLQPQHFIEPRARKGALQGIAAGRIWESKNYQTFIHALARARSRGCDCRLQIVGDGYYRKNLEGLVSQLGLSDYVEFLGRIESQEQLWRYYAGADFSFLLSYSEGLPLAAIEAMATGLPMVMADLPYADDLVTEGVEGFRLHPDDADGAAERLIQWETNEVLRLRMGQAAFEKAKEFCIARQVKRFAEFAEQIVSQDRGKQQ